MRVPLASLPLLSIHRRLLVSPQRLRRLGPGLILVAALSVAALLLADLEARLVGHQLLEPLVLALLMGVVARNVIRGAHPFLAGSEFAAKPVLELAVGLLGVSINVQQIVTAGPALVMLTTVGVVGGIGFSVAMGRLLRLNTKLAILVAVGNAICGNSAIAAVAPVIRADKKDVASSIALTAVLGVFLVLALPLFIPLFGLSHYQYGVLAGMSVYAVPQVVAAAFPVSELSGEVATVVKLARVMLLGPVVIFFALIFQTRGNHSEARRGLGTYVPWFVVMFFILAAVRSAGLLSEEMSTHAKETSRMLTILAMAGLGFGVELAAVRRVGPRVGSAVVISLLFMTAITVALLRVLAITG